MSKSHTKIDNFTVFNTSLIYSRLLCLKKVREIDMNHILFYELAEIHPSLFDEKTGDMHLT